MDWKTLREAMLNIYDQLHVVQVEYFHMWKDHLIFTWRWWCAVAMIVLPWTLWIIIRKRDSTDRLLFAGAVTAILSAFMDTVGVTLHLWTYPVTVFPLMPSYIPFDLSAMPVATMLWLQFFPKMKLIWKALIYAAVGGYVFDPICDGLCLAVEEGWNRIFTFLILFFLYMIAYWVSKRKNFEPIQP